jgi:hypothetical protein
MIRNVLASNELALKRDLTTAQIQEITQRVTNSVAQLELNARALDLQEDAQRYTNALNQAREAEAKARAGQLTASGVKDIAHTVMDIIDYIKEVAN